MTGITGTMENIGRNRGSWSYLSSIVFFPHTARSIFAPAASSKTEASPLSFLYWLAHGFIPCRTGRTAAGCTTVFCLETPTNGLGHRYRTKLRDREQAMKFFIWRSRRYSISPCQFATACSVSACQTDISYPSGDQWARQTSRVIRPKF